MELVDIGGMTVRVRQITRPGTESVDSLSSLGEISQGSLESPPELPSQSLPGYSRLETLMVEVAAHYSVMGCAFVIEGEDGKLHFAASAGPDLEVVAQDGRQKGDRGLFRHHTGRNAPVLIEDLTKVEYFMEHPLVQHAPKLRLYVGAPIMLDDGTHAGMLAIYDDTPRKRKRFGFKDCEFLEEQACEVAKLISSVTLCVGRGD